MALDFGVLDRLQKNDKPSIQFPIEIEQEDDGCSNIHNRLQVKQADHQRAEKIFGLLQDNIRKAGQLRETILQGVRAGLSPTTLFLQAAECISLMTGDRIFYDQIMDDVRTLWGDIIGDKVVLEMELEAVKIRLEKLKTSMEDETLSADARERIKKAIEHHEQRCNDLERLLTDKTEIRNAD